jgi:hypothetical protein
MSILLLKKSGVSQKKWRPPSTQMNLTDSTTFIELFLVYTLHIEHANIKVSSNMRTMRKVVLLPWFTPISLLCNYSSGHLLRATRNSKAVPENGLDSHDAYQRLCRLWKLFPSRPLSTSSERNPTDAAGIHAHDSWNLCEISFLKRVLCERYLCWRSFHVFQRRAFFPAAHREI